MSKESPALVSLNTMSKFKQCFLLRKQKVNDKEHFLYSYTSNRVFEMIKCSYVYDSFTFKLGCCFDVAYT